MIIPTDRSNVVIPPLYLQSEVLFTQSLKASQVSDYEKLHHQGEMDSFHMRGTRGSKRTIAHIVEDKLYERSMLRFQSFKKI